MKLFKKLVLLLGFLIVTQPWVESAYGQEPDWGVIGGSGGRSGPIVNLLFSMNLGRQKEFSD